MATLFGSQFEALAGNPFGSQTVNPVFTTDGSTDPNGNPLSGDTVSGDFNLEVFVGSWANTPTIASGYDGLAVLSPSGATIDLISGSYLVRDDGTGGGSTLNADGDSEEIIGVSGDMLNANGSFDTVSAGGGGQTVTINGALNTATVLEDTVTVNSDFNVINDFGGNALTIVAASNQVQFGANDTISVVGSFNELDGGGSGGTNSINIDGDYNAVTDLNGGNSITVTGSHDTLSGSSATDTGTVTGDFDSISTTNGSLTVAGDFDTVIGGTTVVAGGAHDVITANTNISPVTITANGDFDTISVTNNPQNVTVTANGSHDMITAGAAGGTNLLTANGDFDTITGITTPLTASGSNNSIHISHDALDVTGGSNDTIYADENFGGLPTTISGFAQPAGDRIHLTAPDSVAFALAHAAQANGGADTLITLNSGATILLKGITHIDSSFFV